MWRCEVLRGRGWRSSPRGRKKRQQGDCAQAAVSTSQMVVMAGCVHVIWHVCVCVHACVHTPLNKCAPMSVTSTETAQARRKEEADSLGTVKGLLRELVVSR